MTATMTATKVKHKTPARAAAKGTAGPEHQPAGKPASKPATQASAAGRQGNKAPQDAIALLKADHAAVNRLFADYEKTRSVSDKKALVTEICVALSVHMQIEEEVFYPAVKDALKDKLLVPEASVEHAGVKDLIAQLEGAEPGGESYDAKVKVLSEYVKHHVKEEHEEMFPKVKSSSLDTDELGARMAARKDDLLSHAV